MLGEGEAQEEGEEEGADVTVRVNVPSAETEGEVEAKGEALGEALVEALALALGLAEREPELLPLLLPLPVAQPLFVARAEKLRLGVPLAHAEAHAEPAEEALNVALLHVLREAKAEAENVRDGVAQPLPVPLAVGMGDCEPVSEGECDKVGWLVGEKNPEADPLRVAAAEAVVLEVSEIEGVPLRVVEGCIVPVPQPLADVDGQALAEDDRDLLVEPEPETVALGAPLLDPESDTQGEAEGSPVEEVEAHAVGVALLLAVAHSVREALGL